jgi:hypothetical protein
MTNDERNLLIQTARSVAQLSSDRDDMVVGVTAILLDLYRVEFESGRQNQSEAIARLQIQRNELNLVEPHRFGVLFLEAVIAALRDGKLDAAKLMRSPPAGTA